MKFPRFRKRTPLVSVVRLEGVIASGGMVRSSALNDAGIAPLIERAFRQRQTERGRARGELARRIAGSIVVDFWKNTPAFRGKESAGIRIR